MNIDIQEIKLFIYSDIEREIQLARATADPIKKKEIEKLQINPGGGNFLSALGLLCYTEFIGNLKYQCNCPSDNFNKFFDELGDQYSYFRKSRDVYNIFRCGLAHEYSVKRNCTIYMLKGTETCGIGQEKSGKYYFSIERYFEDFKIPFEKYIAGGIR